MSASDDASTACSGPQETEPVSPLSKGLLKSSLWTLEDYETRLTWVALLAMADGYGRVHCSVPGLASMARVPIEKAEAALSKFLAPDKYSSSPAEDGRRLIPIPGGWKLVTYATYKSILANQVRKANKAAWARERRRQRGQTSTQVDAGRPTVSPSESPPLSNPPSVRIPPPSLSRSAKPRVIKPAAQDAPGHPRRQVSDHWCAKYLGATGEKYGWTGSKDGEALSDLMRLGHDDVAAIKAKIDRAFDGRGYWSGKITNLKALVSHWPDLVEINGLARNGHLFPPPSAEDIAQWQDWIDRGDAGAKKRALEWFAKHNLTPKEPRNGSR